MKKIKSLSFKLSFIYGLSFFLSALILAILVNLVLQRTYEPPFDEMQSIFSQYDENIDRLLDNPEVQEEVRSIQEKAISEVRLRMSVALILFTIASAVTGYFLSKSMLNPIKKLSKATRIINENKLNAKIDNKNVDDELGELVHNFNTMLVRLNTSFEAQKHFVENASHELKTPLTIMKSNAQGALLRKEISSNELKKALKKTVESADRLTKLVDNLLSLAQTGLKDIDLEPIDIISSINNSIDEISNLAKEKNIDIEFIHEKEKYIVLGSPNLLNKVWINLLDNAIKYSDNGSPVKLKTKRNGKFISINFIDYGHGILEEKTKYIFDRFYRIDNSRSKSSGGNGIGLSIVKSVLELHNGHIFLSSEINKGSIFSVTLPLIEE